MSSARMAIRNTNRQVTVLSTVILSVRLDHIDSYMRVILIQSYCVRYMYFQIKFISSGWNEGKLIFRKVGKAPENNEENVANVYSRTREYQQAAAPLFVSNIKK